MYAWIVPPNSDAFFQLRGIMSIQHSRRGIYDRVVYMFENPFTPNSSNIQTVMPLVDHEIFRVYVTPILIDNIMNRHTIVLWNGAQANPAGKAAIIKLIEDSFLTDFVHLIADDAQQQLNALAIEELDDFRVQQLVPMLGQAARTRDGIFESFFSKNFVMQVNPFYKILEKYNNQYPLVHFPKKMNIEIRMYNLRDLSNMTLSILFFMTLRSVSQKNFNHNDVQQQENNIADFVHSFKRMINRLTFVNAQGKDVKEYENGVEIVAAYQPQVNFLTERVSPMNVFENPQFKYLKNIYKKGNQTNIKKDEPSENLLYMSEFECIVELCRVLWR